MLTGNLRKSDKIQFKFSLAFVLLLFFAQASQGSVIGEIKPKSGATLDNTYTWDCREFKSKAGAKLINTWTFDGKELRRKSGATLKDTYVWNGKELKPKAGATLNK